MNLFMMTTCQRIWEAMVRVTEAVLPFKDVVLLPGERMKLGGTLFDEAGEFVRHVADGLGGRPHLFPDITVTAKELLSEQAEADALLWLAERLAFFTQRVKDAYLIRQAGAIDKSMDVVQRVRNPPSWPLSRDQRVDRAIRMQPALALLDRRQRRKRRKARHALDAAAPPESAPPSGNPPPPGAPPPSGGKPPGGEAGEEEPASPRHGRRGPAGGGGHRGRRLRPD